jgi:hypothetical protein
MTRGYHQTGDRGTVRGAGGISIWPRARRQGVSVAMPSVKPSSITIDSNAANVWARMLAIARRASGPR